MEGKQFGVEGWFRGGMSDIEGWVGVEGVGRVQAEAGWRGKVSSPVEGWMVGIFLVKCCGLQLRARWRGMFIKGWVGGRDGFIVERWMVGKD